MAPVAAMGWQDRDYAKWTDEERRRFLGSGSPRFDGPRTAPRPGGSLLRPGAGLAIVVTAGIVTLGQLPAGHPLLPRLHFGIPGLTTAAPALQAPVTQTGTISGPGTAALGSTLTLRGSAPPATERVTVEGSYDGGRIWLVLSTTQSANGSYATQIVLNRRGLLRLKILFANGASTVGSVLVR